MQIQKVIDCASEDAPWVQRMTVCRLIASIDLEVSDQERALEFALGQSADSNAFVRAWALYALAALAAKDPCLRPRIAWMLCEAYEGDRPSVRARAREGLRLLGLPLE